MGLNLRKRLIDFLQSNKDTTFTAREIAQWIFENFPKECAEKKQASTASYIKTDADLVQQLVAEIGGSRPRWQKQHPQLKTIEGRPRRYYWTDKDDSAEVEAAESQEIPPASPAIKAKLSEHDLYPRLAAYLYAEHQLYACRIDEKRSANKSGSGANEWLHPDMAGLEDLSGDWTRELRDCVGVLAERRARLWSFEVKLLVNRSNVRKCYFQAVSNSSWSHFGYLVAAAIEGDETMKELRMLAATHGIGVIQLDSDNPSESQILIPARERAEIDWDMCNRLTEENKDFVDYISRVRRFYQTGETHVQEWDVSKQAS